MSCAAVKLDNNNNNNNNNDNLGHLKWLHFVLPSHIHILGHRHYKVNIFSSVSKSNLTLARNQMLSSWSSLSSSFLFDFTDLRQLFSDVSSDKHSLQINPQVLHHEPVLDDLRGSSQLGNPLLDITFEWRIVPDKWTTNFSSHACFRLRFIMKQTWLKQDSPVRLRLWPRRVYLMRKYSNSKHSLNLSLCLEIIIYLLYLVLIFPATIVDPLQLAMLMFQPVYSPSKIILPPPPTPRKCHTNRAR